MAEPSAFSSVKLPASLVNSARESALAFRRSTAGQIEYWAILGKAAEDSGLTVREAQAAIAAHQVAQDAASNEKTERQQAAAALTAKILSASATGALAQRVRDVVQANRAHAV
jgi:ParD-like antitoxin of type II bacterial toxin-antitoxin system